MKKLELCLGHSGGEVENNAFERVTRLIALGRTSFLFASSACGGKAVAIAYSLMEPAKLNGIDT